MGKKNRKNKTARTRRNEVQVPARSHSRSRSRILVASVAGVIIVAVAALLFIGNDSDTAPSRQTITTSNQTTNVLADNKQTTPSGSHGPSIHFPEPSYDFGSISQGDKVSHTFVVQNKGDESLKLIRAQGT